MTSGQMAISRDEVNIYDMLDSVSSYYLLWQNLHRSKHLIKQTPFKLILILCVLMHNKPA